MRRSIRLLVIWCFGMPCPHLGAQEFRALVVLPDGVTPAAGVMIEAENVDVPNVKARAITGRLGQFMLRAPRAGRYRVRAKRIGFEPTDLGVVDLTEDQRWQAPVVLGALTVSLDVVRVAANRACSVAPGSGTVVASLLDQARLAIATTLLTSPDGAATATWQRFSIYTDRLGTPLTPLRVHTLVSTTDRPFRGQRIDALARHGFVEVTDADVTYYAPDAEALLSDRFVHEHCFRLEPSHPERSDWVGLRFEPTPNPEMAARVTLVGTLWMDRASAELRRLDFTYGGLDRVLSDAGAGGNVTFRRLPTGVWLVDSWQLRMPRAEAIRVDDLGASIVMPSCGRTVNSVEVVGGMVRSVERGSVELYRGTLELSASLPEIAARVGQWPVCETPVPETSSRTGIVAGMVLDSTQSPVRGAVVRATWTNTGGSRFSRSELRVTTELLAPDGFFMLCAAPVGWSIEFVATAANDSRARERIRLEPEQPFQSIELRLGPP